MRVGVEVIAAGSVLGEGQGGASGYIEGLIPRMLEDPRISRLFVYTADTYEPATAWRHPKLELRRWKVPAARPARVAFEQCVLPVRVLRDGLDVLFCTANYRPLAYRGTSVVALHAVQHFLLDDEIGRMRSAYLKFAVPRSVRGADMTVGVTDTLRTDAIKLFDLDPVNIVSVPMGPSPWVLGQLQDDAPAVEPYRLPDGAPYVLCISRLYALKNHRRLIEAFARLGDLPHRLVIVGGDADVTRAELEEVARANGVEDRVLFLGRVAQADVPGLYAGAEVIAYVSLYETFGHPVLEAFATRTPLVTSTSGATGEVAGGAARLVDPTDVADIAAGLREVLTDAGLRERMVAAGAARVRDFSWQKCATGTVDALAEAVARRGS